VATHYDDWSVVVRTFEPIEQATFTVARFLNILHFDASPAASTKSGSFDLRY
jgi:hypothetical protein